jgi:phosphoglycolate phosphatase-like HAD superfamily hydrolase
MGAKALIEGELIIAIDFDGTITNEPEISDTMTLREGAKEVLLRLHESGARLVLWTCRTARSLQDAQEFLREHQLDKIWSAINRQIPEINLKYRPHIARKVGADVYFDDKAMLGRPVNWYEFAEFIFGEDEDDFTKYR